MASSGNRRPRDTERCRPSAEVCAEDRAFNRHSGSESGFTLVEVLVAAVVGVMLVLGAGLLGDNLVRRRASADAIAAAMALAERQLEQLFALQNPATAGALTAGTHGPGTCVSPPCKITASGDTNTLTGPYLMQWTVVDNATAGTPLIDPTSPSATKKITMSVTHTSDPLVRAALETYYKYR